MWQYLVVAVKLSIILYFELNAIRDIYFFHTVVSTDCDENVYIVYFEEIYFYGLTRVCILYKYFFCMYVLMLNMKIWLLI